MTVWRNIYRILGEQSRVLKEMTSITTTTLKAGKKTASNPIITTASPLNQRSTEGSQKAEKNNTTPNMQTMQATLTLIQETMVKMQNTMSINHGEMKLDIQKLDNKMNSIQEAIHKNEQRIKIIEDKTEQTGEKLDLVDQKMMAINKDLKDSIIQLEMDRASFFLRFQNVTEAKDEDLGQIMAGIIAESLQRDKQEIMNELDEVYRIQTNYARRHKLPREVHIRFARKKIRDIVYNITREEPMIYKGKEIITLKQIPRRVREQRKDYRFLAAQLNKRNILFRWILPEGMLMSWQGKKVKIDSLAMAQDFFDQLTGNEEDQSSREEIETVSQEEDQVKEGTREERSKKEKGIQELRGIKTRSQVVTRVNRD